MLGIPQGDHARTPNPKEATDEHDLVEERQTKPPREKRENREDEEGRAPSNLPDVFFHGQDSSVFVCVTQNKLDLQLIIIIIIIIIAVFVVFVNIGPNQSMNDWHWFGIWVRIELSELAIGNGKDGMTVFLLSDLCFRLYLSFFNLKVPWLLWYLHRRTLLFGEILIWVVLTIIIIMRAAKCVEPLPTPQSWRRVWLLISSLRMKMARILVVLCAVINLVENITGNSLAKVNCFFFFSLLFSDFKPLYLLQHEAQFLWLVFFIQ